MGNVSMKQVNSFLRTPQGSRTVVRALDSCQVIPRCTTIVCADGTLAKGSLRCVEAWVSGKRYDPDRLPTISDSVNPLCIPFLQEGIVFNTKFPLTDDLDGRGDPTERALLLFLRDMVGLSSSTLSETRQQGDMREIVRFPFNARMKRVSVLVQNAVDEEGGRLYCHGAPAAFIEGLCSKKYSQDDEEVQPIGAAERDALRQTVQDFEDKGYNTIVFGYRDFASDQDLPLASSGTEDPQAERANLECDLVLYAIVGIKDPIASEAASLMTVWKRQGLAVRLVTRSSVEDAQRVAKECGIIEESDDEDAVSFENQEFRDVDPRIIRVLARTQPLLKRDFVMDLKGRGETVAFLGGTTSDAHALKAADVGFVLRNKDVTPAALETADIVIGDGKMSTFEFMWNYFRK